MKFIYAYTGYNIRNELVSGKIEAKNKAEAMSSIRSAKRVTECKLVGVQFRNGLSKAKLSMFFGQLGYLLNAGLALHKAIACLAESGDKDTKALADKMYLDISIGKSFADAFRGMGGLLADRFCPQLEAAEKGANLDETLRDISIQLKKESKNSRSLATAMVYPGLTLCMAFGIAAFLLISVIPDMASILYELGGTLPWLTRAMIAFSEFLVQWGIVLALVIGILLYLFIRFIRGRGKLWWDGLLVKVPLMGTIILNSEQINFYRSLYYMINSGLPFVPALEFSVATVMNKRFRTDLEGVVARVRTEGVDLATAMTPIKYLDPIQLQAIRVGIEANKLQQTLYDTAENLEEINDEAMERLKPVLNIVLIAVVGVVVGIIMFAVYLPMFTVMATL